MTATVAILVPVLNRPQRVAPLLESITAATPQPHRVVFVVDPDDTAQRAAVAEHDVDELVEPGSYARKINAATAAANEPKLFLGADDLTFHPGWLEAAAALLDDQVGVVGTNDLGNARVVAGEHATHSLVAHWYAQMGTIDEPGSGKLLHDGYLHNFCDDELVATARHRGAWAFAPDAIVEHHHPCWGKAETDGTYERGQAHFHRDRRRFRGRRHLWT